MSERSLTEKLALTVIVLVFSPFVEVVTGAAPIGAAVAVTSLWTIWDVGEEPAPTALEGGETVDE
jgi:hypothetical protein